MYKIGNVTLNTKFYNGNDRYNDGDIENEILTAVMNHTEAELLQQDSRWPILVHLAPERKNLLSWYDFDKKENLLEIGAGCGALTGLFCEKVDSVTAIELSKRRSEISAYRSNFDNLEIMIGNLNDMMLEKKFGYVTLIGVLEYAGRFTDSSEPYVDFLRKCKSYLHSNGTLIIAIENRLGLKYWLGAPEDHTGIFFDGIENYVKNPMGVATFSRPRMEDMLRKAGFNTVDFFYPYPDYKLPDAIYSDNNLPSVETFEDSDIPYDLNRWNFADKNAVLKSIVEDRLFGLFSNSFLIFAK